MATTANISFNGSNQIITSDGYPSNIIPQILNMKHNIKFGFDLTKNTEFNFKDSADRTLNYTYDIDDSMDTLTFKGYGDTKVIIDLNELMDIKINESDETFKTIITEDIPEYIALTPAELEMSTKDYLVKYDGNHYDETYHIFAKRIVKKITI